MLLKDKRAVVTGASSGIGRAIALALATAGADVVVNYRQSAARAAQVVAEIEQLGRRAWAVPADVAQAADVTRLVETAWQTMGAVSVWVNNAGADIITQPHRQRPAADRLAQVLDVDVRGTVLCSWAVGQRMQQAGSGVILNIGWDKAWLGMAGETAELFAVAKGAVMAFTKSLARTLAPQVRVNCLAPGWVQTAWGETASSPWQERVIGETPLGRWGQPEDIAKAAVFLCSDEAAFITGQILNVNGGVV
ncbi:MAG: SDR family oxidoreductase [Chloroflexota bacterium]